MILSARTTKPYDRTKKAPSPRMGSSGAGHDWRRFGTGNAPCVVDFLHRRVRIGTISANDRDRRDAAERRATEVRRDLPPHNGPLLGSGLVSRFKICRSGEPRAQAAKQRDAQRQKLRRADRRVLSLPGEIPVLPGALVPLSD